MFTFPLKVEKTAFVEFKITVEISGQRVDRALLHQPQITSRTRAQQLIEMGLILLGGEPVKPSHIVKTGEIFEVNIPEKMPSQLVPLQRPLDILFEDDDIIVLNKPAGLVMHPSVGHEQDTLVNALLAHTDKLSIGFGEKRPGIVHRLDRDTSGVVVIARNDKAHQNLADQFKARSILRLYHAIIFGVPVKKSGHIESYLGRHSQDRKRFASVDPEHGKWAATNYHVLATSNFDFSLVELKLETGRTHQIRVHLGELGHPVLGDTTYSGRFSRKINDPLKGLIATAKRFALHASELGLNHPSTGNWMMFKVDWPQDLLPIIDYLGFQ